jgi:hypothetical protein
MQTFSTGNNLEADAVTFLVDIIYEFGHWFKKQYFLGVIAMQAR